MSFKEWVNTVFDTDVDLNDIDEDSCNQLEAIYDSVMRKEK